MELRYLLTGISIIAITFVFSVYGVMARDSRAIGVSLSLMILGVMFLAIGATYTRILEELLKQYSRDLDVFTTKVLEDMGVVSSNRTRLCLRDSLVVFSEKSISCGSLMTGVGIKHDTFYVAIPIANTLQAISRIIEEERSLANAVKKFVIDTCGLCRALSVSREGDIIAVEMHDLTDLSRKTIGYPINVVRIGVIATVAVHLRTDVEVVEEVITTNSYRLKVRVEGSGHG